MQNVRNEGLFIKANARKGCIVYVYSIFGKSTCYLFISLDIFGGKIHSEGVTDETEAWLAFLRQDDPEIIIGLIKAYPEFHVMYEE